MLARTDAVAALRAERFDVVVVGGGITGAGVALDAASRGYRVALVERNDFASGTSSRSSKLVHGGLRYLQSFDLGLVREALLERQLLTALAPHLVTPLPLVVAAFDGARLDRMTGLGLNLYDAMALRVPRRGNGGPLGAAAWRAGRHRVIDGDEVVELVPALARRRPTSGYVFFDCQTDDARLVLTVLGEAERFGAVAAGRLEAIELVLRDGRAGGVRLLDRESGELFDLAAGNVVNATGVWADRLSPGELSDEAEAPSIRPSRGTHIVLARDALPLVGGVVVPAGGGRSIFALPWLGSTLIGTTDRDYALNDSLEHVPPSSDDVAYLLDATNAHFAAALTEADVRGAFAGVRPLIASGDARRSVDISRRAELYETSSGMITITGGKLTTFRRMAKQTVDRLVERDEREAPCRTQAIALGQPADAERLPRVGGVAPEAYAMLAGRYGEAATKVLAIASERDELARPVLAGYPDILAEAAFAARHEQARTVGDVLLRRTRLGLLAGRELARDQQTAAGVAAVLGAELGWDPARELAEREAFAAEARAEGIAC